MTLQGMAERLRAQMRERPYWTTAACVGVGWMLGRSLPLRALFAVGGLAARAAAASALEAAIVHQVGTGFRAGDERRTA